MDRRTFLLAGAGAVVLAACGGKSAADDSGPRGASSTDASPTTAGTTAPTTAAPVTAAPTTAAPANAPAPTPAPANAPRSAAAEANNDNPGITSPPNAHAPEPVNQHRHDRGPQARSQHRALRRGHADDAQQGGRRPLAGHRVAEPVGQRRRRRAPRHAQPTVPQPRHARTGRSSDLHDRQRSAHLHVREQRDRASERHAHRQPVGGQDRDVVRMPSTRVERASASSCT